MNIWESIYSTVTRDIRVSVLPEHLEDRSDPAASVFAFAYAVRIENLGTETVQLLERHWIINSNGEHFAEVVGPGVVGEQPTLKNGGVFEYSSSAVIQHPVGSMHGSYTFRSANGDFFQVSIPKFDLFYPVMIH
jgi:ApaG protein